MSMQPSEDERVLAALSHASIVANAVNLAGMIATSLIWTMHRDLSPYVRAHALHALVYQGAVLLIMLFLALFGGLCLALSLLPAILRPDLYRGVIAAGKLADMVLIDGDPTQDIRDSNKIQTVIKGGKVYDPAAIEKALGIAPR